MSDRHQCVLAGGKCHLAAVLRWPLNSVAVSIDACATKWSSASTKTSPVRAESVSATRPLCSTWQATDELPLWTALEREVGGRVPPPMYAAAWPGSQALARVIQDGRIAVSSRRVLDVGCGSGVAACAAALHGGSAVGVDVDPLALCAAEALAERHDIQLGTLLTDPLDNDALTARFDVILVGDLFYDEKTAARGARAVARWVAQGKTVLLADGGRPFFSHWGLPLVFEADVSVARSVEGVGARHVRVFGNV